MSFVKFSTEKAVQSFVRLENIFITEYLPYAPENCVKVYLYGLMLIESGMENSLEKMAVFLNMEQLSIIKAYEYWQDEGLVRLIHGAEQPIVEYLPVKSAHNKIIKFKPDKYQAFNAQLEASLPGRNILPNEFHEYYMLMETKRLEESALLEIISYCVKRKGDAIGHAYILTVAKNLMRDGFSTYEQVNLALSQSERSDPNVLAVFKSLGLKRAPEYEDAQLYKKWTEEFGFKSEDILFASKKCKKATGGNKLAYLDGILSKYFANQVLSKSEMQDYDEKRELMFSTAKRINYYLGLNYENLSYLVETYVGGWLAKGFEAEAIICVAQAMSKNPHRSWDNLNTVIERLYNEGMVSVNAVSKYYDEMRATDELIKKLFMVAGLEKSVATRDRDSFRTWSYTWGFDYSVIEYAASLAKGKLSPLPFMNSVLAAWHEAGVKTVEKAYEINKLTAPQSKEMPKEIIEKKQRAQKTRENKARLRQNYDRALADPDFLSAQTRIRELELALAKSDTEELHVELELAKQGKLNALKAMGLTEDDILET